MHARAARARRRSERSRARSIETIESRDRIDRMQSAKEIRTSTYNAYSSPATISLAPGIPDCCSPICLSSRSFTMNELLLLPLKILLIAIDLAVGTWSLQFLIVRLVRLLLPSLTTTILLFRSLDRRLHLK